MMDAVRDIQLKIRLVGGHEHIVSLPEDSPELPILFTALSNPGESSRFVQLPMEGGRSACSFQTAQLVSIVSEPPVVLELVMPSEPARREHATIASRLRRPRFKVIDDFLSRQEHRELLAYALLSEPQFKAGTVVASYEPEARQNRVIMEFGESAHGRMLQNRLLIYFPLLAKSLGMPVFPVGMLESQLTAAGDGHFFKAHSDDAPDVPRALSCVYYLHREPRGFAGGDIRIYDCIEEGGLRRPADTFTAIEPLANRMVVFPSEEFHAAMPVRCPSRAFADSRFAVTTWIHRAARPEPTATMGWGHFRCGVLAPQFATDPASERGQP